MRNGGVYIALAGNLSKGVIYIIISSGLLGVLSAIGALASIASFVLYLHDRKKR